MARMLKSQRLNIISTDGTNENSRNFANLIYDVDDSQIERIIQLILDFTQEQPVSASITIVLDVVN
ncbi:hypothetical protein [Lacticaseibacillus jixiensis]|uniref:hypothetical protein n=1 Tax=Lacticaseibacillus jixiensis TaxID=3231926 RepID=UPI0036F37E46